MHPLLAPLEGTLIVSCQAYPGEPMRDPGTMAQVAAAVEAGGASAVRAQGLEDIACIGAAVEVPVIGIWKDGTEGVRSEEHTSELQSRGQLVCRLLLEPRQQ